MDSKRQSTGEGQPSILAVHPGALGDVILFGHLLSRLQGRVTLLAGREKAELLVGAGVAGRALDFDAIPMHEVFADTPPAQCKLPGLLDRHDRLVACFPAGDRRAELRLAAMCGAADAAFLPVRPHESFNGHLLDLWCDLLAIDCSAAGPSAWRVPQVWREAAKAALAGAGIDAEKPHVLIHPGSGAADKCWPLERFLKLSESLRAPVFILGPVECDRWAEGRIEALRRERPVLLSPALSVLAGLAAGASAFVGNDSGVAHLAAAVGAATVVLFGPTRVEHFAPLGPTVKAVTAERLDEITPKQVLRAVQGAPPWT